MTVYKRKDIPKLMEAVRKGETSQIYLLVGERFLCQDVCEELINVLLPDEKTRQGNLETLDSASGGQGRLINLARTYSLFSGRRVIRMMDTTLFHSKEVGKQLWNKAQKAFEGDDRVRAAAYIRQLLSLAKISAEELGEEGLMGIAVSHWQDIFGFAKPAEDISWTEGLLIGPQEGEEQARGSVLEHDPAEVLEDILSKGIPASNIIILTAEAVDKRKRLYKYLAGKETIIDLSVDAGAGSMARKDQEAVLRELMEKTLTGFGKKIVPQAVPLLLDRIGFHPVAVVRETEKLALYTGDKKTITVADLDQVIGRTRDEALYELTEAVGTRDLPGALKSLSRLSEQGIHPLAILAACRKYIRRLLLIRSYQDWPVVPYQPKMTYQTFKDGYLLKFREAKDPLPESLGQHPYALYKLFGLAETFTLAKLIKGLSEVLETEYRLKGSNLPPVMLLENLMFRLNSCFMDEGPVTKY